MQQETVINSGFRVYQKTMKEKAALATVRAAHKHNGRQLNSDSNQNTILDTITKVTPLLLDCTIILTRKDRENELRLTA